ncbi:macro domain-like protein [Daldinia caldariorum]|uniref:macro domain-like protein n=1 Tax=Daldinia caldariorum TaxID=326644 RepID=UPI0020071F51|nr:macro domain-like protein [Daldinia caldariorum]KAI1473030.1 macro domain-like protein [Daldinia caldariorum]
MPSVTQPIPYIHLLCMHESASDAFVRAAAEQGLEPPLLNFTIHNTYLADLAPSVTFDLVVSPANSYGILDGGFDDAISRAFSPRGDYDALTRVAQRELYRLHGGYLPPGSCCLVRIPEPFRGTLRYHDGRGWGCRFLALCPTMRVPAPCDWDRDVVYECVWSLLNAIERHNRGVEAEAEEEEEEGGEGASSGSGSTKIGSILMTPLGTGTGKISDDKWAKQAVLAIKHFIDAKQHPETWSAMSWKETGKIDIELMKTQSPSELARYFQR